MCTKKDNIVCVIYVSENQLLILFGKGSQSAIFYRNMTEMFIYVVGWSAITTVRDRKILEREKKRARFKLMAKLFVLIFDFIFKFMENPLLITFSSICRAF